MLDRQLVLPHTLAERALESPDKVVLEEVGGRSLTYKALYEETLEWARGAQALGVGAGDTVITMFSNCIDAYVAWLGLAWLNAIEVPVNTAYHGDTLHHVLSTSQARVAIVSHLYVDAVVEQLDALQDPVSLIVPDSSSVRSDLPCEVLTRDEFLEKGAPNSELPGPSYCDIATMIFTSGTTGPAKGVLVPWAEIYEFPTGSWPEDMLPEDGAFYGLLPPSHLGGKFILYGTVLWGGRLVLRETFSLSEFWSDIEQFQCTTTQLISAMAALLLRQPPQEGDSETPLRNVGLLPLIPEVEEFKRRFGVRVMTAYGMTEIGLPISSEGWNLVDNESCGRCRTGYPGYEVRIVDEYDEEVPPGTVGELVVRSDAPWVINAGYFHLPEKTAESWRNGWFHTGDAFRADEHGNFYFVDRIKDAIRRRGENVSSFQVEGLVRGDRRVSECAAVGVPSELGEEDIKIVVVPEEQEVIEPSKLLEDLGEAMPSFMVPRYVEVVEELPKTQATGRVRKVQLREDLLNRNTWDRELNGYRQ